jgi:phosphate transport system permease protein
MLSKINISSLFHLEFWFKVFLLLASLLSGLMVLFIGLFLFYESLPALRVEGFWQGLLGKDWYPIDGDLGQLPMILGTAYSSFIALLISVPLSLSIGLFLAFEKNNWLKEFFTFVVEILAAVPSVVYGLWGLTHLVPWLLNFHPPGTNLLCAGLILAIMIAPTMIIVMVAGFKSLPQEWRMASDGIGLSHYVFLKNIILPNSKNILGRAFILGAGRALGETMAVLMVAGNVAQIPTSVWRPIRTLTANMALEMAYAMDGHRSALYVSGLLLLVVIGLLLFGHGLLTRKKVQHVF